jgi:hypothetical protein
LLYVFHESLRAAGYLGPVPLEYSTEEHPRGSMHGQARQCPKSLLTYANQRVLGLDPAQTFDGIPPGGNARLGRNGICPSAMVEFLQLVWGPIGSPPGD